MQKQPLLILCICFILGIVLQDYFSLQNSIVYLLLIFGFVSLLLFFIKNFSFFRFRYAALWFLFFALGVFAHFLNSQKPALPTLKSTENVVFKINKKLNSNEKNRRYEITIYKENVSLLSVLSLPKTEAELDFLHYYKGDIFINRLQQPYSDFQFDYSRYLGRKGIYFQSYLPNSFHAGVRTDLSFAEKIRQKRLETLRKIDSTNLSKRTREFTKGIILADRTEMDSETVQDFRKSGLMHILAISGSHMAIIFWLILIIFDFIFPPKFRNLKIIIALILIWAFAIFIDYGSSVVRSCIMISAYYIYVLLQRKPDLLHAMAVAAFGILIIDTNQLFDVGFQLSFVAVFGIFWLNQPILKYLPQPKNKFQNSLVNVVSISISAQIVTLPLVIYYFHQYSYISILANLVIIPFSEILIIFSLLMTILIALGINFSWITPIYDWAVNFTLDAIHLFAEADFAYSEMIPMTMPEVAVGFAIIYYLRFAVKNFSIKNVLNVVYFIFGFIALRLMLNYKAQQLDEVLVHHYFKEKVISVKQNDQVQFVLRENRNMNKIDQYVIAPYLTSRRVKNFDLKILPEDAQEVKIDGTVYRFEELRD